MWSYSDCTFLEPRSWIKYNKRTEVAPPLATSSSPSPSPRPYTVILDLAQPLDIFSSFEFLPLNLVSPIIYFPLGDWDICCYCIPFI